MVTHNHERAKQQSGMPPLRVQASLYLQQVPSLEDLRRRFNPRQAELIPAHVTLCREDEVDDWRELKARALGLDPLQLKLTFGRPVREQNLVYLPVVEGLDAFRMLRETLLGASPRDHDPHITLIHPRNGNCTDDVFDEIMRLSRPFSHTFEVIRVIEQRNGGVWRTVFRSDSAGN